MYLAFFIDGKFGSKANVLNIPFPQIYRSTDHLLAYL